MPADCHSGISLSMFIMFIDARYIAGARLCTVAAFVTAIIGDGHVRPVANQFSISGTQKSESECVIMACLSVMMMLSSVK